MKKTLPLLLGVLVLSSSVRAAGLSELDKHISWSVFHEGCSAWSGASLVAGDVFKPCALAAEKDNPSARAIIAAATANEIESALSQAVGDIPQTYNLVAHFSWVLYNQGLLQRFQAFKSQGNFAAIRDQYYRSEVDNPNARNLLAAISDNTIANLIP